MFSKNLIYLSLLFGQVISKALPPGQSPGDTSFATIESSGIVRTYNISIPPNYDGVTATPLIFSFHGATSNPTEQEILSQMSNTEFNDFAIAVYPAGINTTWNLGIPHPKPQDTISTANDLQFVSDMLTEFSSLYALDTNRIWAAGKSDGGGFCNVLACNATLSTQIAAFAPVSGAFYIPGLTGATCNPLTAPISCSPGRPKIPIIEFHGAFDTTIDYDGSSSRDNSCLPTIPHWTQEWALRDGLSATNTSSNLTSDTVKYTFGPGDETGLVTQYTDFNTSFHHDWPSTVLEVVLDGGDKDVASFNATPIIMKFFEDNPLA